MYLWIGIDVEDDLEALKIKTRKIEREIGFAHSNFTLPLHISVKISFPIKEHLREAIIDDILAYYHTLSPFALTPTGIECEDTIVWVRYKQSAALDKIHDALNALLHDRYGVGLHEYDLDYKFHTTCFMDENVEKIQRAYALIKDEPLPASVMASRFVIGYSESGALGTYRILHTVDAQ